MKLSKAQVKALEALNEAEGTGDASIILKEYRAINTKTKNKLVSLGLIKQVKIMPVFIAAILTPEGRAALEEARNG